LTNDKRAQKLLVSLTFSVAALQRYHIVWLTQISGCSEISVILRGVHNFADRPRRFSVCHTPSRVCNQPRDQTHSSTRWRLSICQTVPLYWHPKPVLNPC